MLSGSSLQFQGSSTQGSMDHRPRPLEPDLNSTGISLPAPMSVLNETIGYIQPGAINRSSHSNDNFVRPQPRSILSDWYTSPEKPWDPIQGRLSPAARTGIDWYTSTERTWDHIQGRVAPGTGDLRMNRLVPRPSGPAFSVYRESNLSSECESTGPGLLPSDSGYESRTRQSVGTGSTYEDCDRSGETGSISSHLAGFQLGPPLCSDPWGEHGSGNTTASSVSVSKNKLECETCKQKVKTRSELKY